MGEQPLFSCKAHVFQLEPELKKSWIALSTVAVNVQIFHDPIKNIYRIVSIEGTKALINSIVTAKMTFTKTSQKFGQWIDFKLNLVYGLGFPNDSELNKFVEKFKEIKEYTRNSSKSHERSNSCEIISSMSRFKDGSISNERVTKFEADNLKIESNRFENSRKFEEEINTLKLDNSNLNKALNESNSEKEDLKKQIQFYKEEFMRVKSMNNSTNSFNARKFDEFDDASSTSSANSFNLNQSNANPSENKNSKKIKQELNKLIESFDIKLKELYDIRESMQKVCNGSN